MYFAGVEGAPGLGEVRRLCRQWQTLMEGRIRHIAKEGETAKPKTTVEALLINSRELRGCRNALENLVDLFRADVFNPSPLCPSNNLADYSNLARARTNGERGWGLSS